MLMNQITDYNFVAGITSDVIFNVKIIQRTGVSEVSLSFFCARRTCHPIETKKPLPFRGGVGGEASSLLGEGLGRGFYYAIQLVTPSDVPSAVRILISI